MSSERVAMPEQSPKVRATNFDEVALAIARAMRRLRLRAV